MIKLRRSGSNLSARSIARLIYHTLGPRPEVMREPEGGPARDEGSFAGVTGFGRGRSVRRSPQRRNRRGGVGRLI